MTLNAIPDNRRVSHAARTLVDPAMSLADVAAHKAASYIRGNATICPLCQQIATPGHACAGLTNAGLKALHNLELATAEILRDRQTADAARNDIAHADGNWIPNVAPVEDYWDAVIAGYSLLSAA